MHPKVVQDLERSLLASMYEPLHQADRDLRVQRAREDLPAHLALVGHRRNRAQFRAVGMGHGHGSLSLRRRAADTRMVGKQARLIVPLYLRTLFFCLGSDLRVLLADPLRDCRGSAAPDRTAAAFHLDRTPVTLTKNLVSLNLCVRGKFASLGDLAHRNLPHAT